MSLQTATAENRAQFILREADVADARNIAEFVRLSSDGVADYTWCKLAEPGQLSTEVGARYYARRDAEISFQNCVMADVDGVSVGMGHAFEVVAPSPAESDPVLRPYAELEIVGSLFCAAAAVVPGYRNHGIGSTLLSNFRLRAARREVGTLSAMIFESNGDARRLFERHGFREVDRRPTVGHPLIKRTGDMLLYACEL